MTENQQRYCIFQIKYVGPAFVNVSVRKTAFDSFSEDDKDPLVREFCRSNASLTRRQFFKYFVSLYASLEHDFSDALESH